MPDSWLCPNVRAISHGYPDGVIFLLKPRVCGRQPDPGHRFTQTRRHGRSETRRHGSLLAAPKPPSSPQRNPASWPQRNPASCRPASRSETRRHGRSETRRHLRTEAHRHPRVLRGSIQRLLCFPQMVEGAVEATGQHATGPCSSPPGTCTGTDYLTSRELPQLVAIIRVH